MAGAIKAKAAELSLPELRFNVITLAVSFILCHTFNRAQGPKLPIHEATQAPEQRPIPCCLQELQLCTRLL